MTSTAPMFADADLLPLSALQHLVFCERQCALMYIEQLWDENRVTAEGRLFHERVHERQDECRKDLRICRGLRLRSLRLGLVGQADVVEFHREPDGTWRPFPIEYKRGRPKPHDADRVQLCAQAMCLEEMLGVSVPAGALFYGAPRRREEVVLDRELRGKVECAAERLREFIAAGITPPAIYEKKKCEDCSLLSYCRPRMPQGSGAVTNYLARALEEL